MKKTLLIIQGLSIAGVLILGVVALFTVYKDSQNDILSETNESATIPMENAQVHSDKPTIDEDNLQKEKEQQKLTESNVAKDPIKITTQGTNSDEEKLPSQPEDQSHTIISDRVTATPGNTRPDEFLKEYYSLKLTMKSPVDLQIYDEDGNHTGLIRLDGQPHSIRNIPGSTIRHTSGHQVITLPGDRSYNVVLDGMDTDYPDFERYDGDEPLTLEVEIFYGDFELEREILFSAPPVTSKTTGRLTISPENTFSTLKLDYDGDGQVDDVIESTEPEDQLVEYYGIRLIMKSPVDLQIYDEDGNHTGLIRKGVYSSMESNIPGSTMRNVSGYQAITLQGDRSYNVVLEGMEHDYIDYIERFNGDEPFTLEVDVYYGDDIEKEFLFSAPPVTPQTKGSMIISPENTFSTLKLDYDGDGQVDDVIEPTDSED